jgi:hypothetical protein
MATKEKKTPADYSYDYDRTEYMAAYYLSRQQELNKKAIGRYRNNRDTLSKAAREKYKPITQRHSIYRPPNTPPMPRNKKIGEQYEVTTRGVTYLKESTANGEITIKRITPYKDKGKANSLSSPLLGHMNMGKLNRITTKKSDAITELNKLPGTQKVYVADKDRAEKVSLKIGKGMWLMVYPDRLEEYQKKVAEDLEAGLKWDSTKIAAFFAQNSAKHK